ncbi:MAG: rubredoxin-like domain-containing protein [Candidatus Hadarchaeum sp.]|uniref:rubredoxin-like domain-containing protein n=1 Tax=Candidatus Hadarchaeum sp. TaxID=2883567 RepID=UPI003D0BB678
MMKWKCLVCGYIYDGENPPEKCPNCGAPREKFEKLPDDKAQLIERSRYTNDLHVSLQKLLSEVLAVAENGIRDNLDPRCLEIFTQAKEMAWMIRQRSRTEVQTHVGKGKWG